jgi:hypothetical protein
MNSVASFGFELVNLNGNGANAFFPVSKTMVLNQYDIDAAFMVVSATAGGWAEVLCQARICRGGPPTFSGPPAAYLPAPSSSDFGAVNWDNPSGLQLLSNGTLIQDLFYSVILKSFVPASGTASSTHRHVTARPNVLLSAGDYLAFHMDHAGVQVDCELQVVLNYTLV